MYHCVSFMCCQPSHATIYICPVFVVVCCQFCCTRLFKLCALIVVLPWIAEHLVSNKQSQCSGTLFLCVSLSYHRQYENGGWLLSGRMQKCSLCLSLIVYRQSSVVLVLKGQRPGFRLYFGVYGLCRATLDAYQSRADFVFVFRKSSKIC